MLKKLIFLVVLVSLSVPVFAQPNPISIKLNLINSPPDTFSLISPADLDSVKILFLLDWEASTDPDPNDTVHYDLYISRSIVFNPDSTIVYDSLLGTTLFIDNLDTRNWYWTVRAYDNWGAETWANDTSSFFVYICGDYWLDGDVSIVDVPITLGYLFKGGPPPTPLITMDVNCDGNVRIGDVVYLINYLFKGGPPPCDPTDDGVPLGTLPGSTRIRLFYQGYI
jgi:hypothetical protein